MRLFVLAPRRVHLACALVLVPPFLIAHAAAQRGELGELSFSRSEFRATRVEGAFALSVPEPAVDPSDLPAEVRPLYARYRSALEDDGRLHRAAAEDSDAAGEVARDAARRAVGSARDALLAGLASSEGLSRSALLLLGGLQRNQADLAYEAALASDDGAGPEPDHSAALATWQRITGDDVVAAHARYQLATIHELHGDAEGARALYGSALAVEGLPPELLAAAGYGAGVLSPPEGWAATFGRCASISTPCAFTWAAGLAAEGRTDEALVRLAPVLSADTDAWPGLAAETERLAVDLVARLGREPATHRPPSLSEPRWAGLLDAAAERLAEQGSFTFALAAIDAAETASPSATRAARRQAIVARRAAASETPDAWVRRAVSFCVVGTAPAAGVVSLSWRSRSGRTTLAARVEDAAPLEDLARCLDERAPPPESPVPARGAARLRFD